MKTENEYKRQMNLIGRRALVTGSTGGIGLAVAEELAKNGCSIVLNGFASEQVIATLQRRFEEDYGVHALYVGADVSKPAECRLLFEHARAEVGEVDILVNNAGIQYIAPIDEFPTERWDHILATNLTSAFHLIAAALPAMRANGYGRIINIASVHGMVGSKGKSAYVAAKHGLIGLTKVVALETSGQGVTCNAVCPGWVLTPMVEEQVNNRMQQEGVERSVAEQLLLREKQPSGLFTRPKDVGALAVFLCSEAAANITGASLPIDGAWTAQ